MATVPDATPQPVVLLRYNNVAVAIHWITAALVVTQVWLGFTFAGMERGAERTEVFTWHKTIGVTILLLAIARLVWRLIHKPPPFPETLARWERVAATWNHRAFYFLLIALPVTGLSAVSGGGATTELIGGLRFPTIPGLPEGVGEAHELLVLITLALVVLHVGAALKHQFIDRNRASGRMPPFSSPEVEHRAPVD